MLDNQSVEIIGECSSNHGGDIVLAKEFVHACAEHGADWVKFQTTRVKHLSPADPQYDWFAKAELSDDAHHELKAECEKAGVKFLTTVYNAAEVPFLASLGLEVIKVGSGEADCAPLAEALRTSNIPRVIVSLGLQSDTQRGAFAWWTSPVTLDYGWEWQRDRRVDFLQCVTRYPAPAMCASGPYHWPVVGWSDHCVGLDGCRMAILDGASIIEKHVQLHNQARPPKPYEATMDELKELRQFADENPRRFIGRWQHA